MRNETSLWVPAETTSFTTGSLRSEQGSPTNYAEHINPKSPLASHTNLSRTIGHLRVSRIVFLRFEAPLSVSLGVDSSSTMIPQILGGRRGQPSCLSLPRPNGSAYERGYHKA